MFGCALRDDVAGVRLPLVTILILLVVCVRVGAALMTHEVCTIWDEDQWRRCKR